MPLYNVRPTDLFHIDKPVDSVTWMFMINRMQTLYYVTYISNVVTEASLMWVILLAAMCSHLNILLILRWFRREDTPNGYLGVVRVFGRPLVWMFALVGLALVLVKSSVFTLAYVETVHHILFPNFSLKLFVVLLVIACLYLARLGMEQTLRFAIIAFVGTIWVVGFYVSFLFPATADYYHLLPLFPDHVPPNAWQVFFTIWGAFSGPEYLLVLPKRIVKIQRLKIGLLIGNALTTCEYLFFFCIALVFYGSEYLRRQDLPTVQLIRYIHLPFVERLEMIMLPAYALSMIYVISILLLYATGALRILTGASFRHSGRKRLVSSFVLLLVVMLIFENWVWEYEPERDRWVEWLTRMDATTYAILPTVFVVAAFVHKKWGKRHALRRN